MKLYAQKLLQGNQWLVDQIISIDSRGFIETIESGVASEADEQHALVLPGMVNCHSHAFQRAFAGLSEYRANPSDSFWSWRDIMYRFVATMTPEDNYNIAAYAYLEMLKTGYTSVAEFHYLHHGIDGQPYDDPAEMASQMLHAADTSGIGLTLLPVLYSFAGFGEKSPSKAQARFIHSLEDYCLLLDSCHRLIGANPQVNLGMAPHSLRAVSQQQLPQAIAHIRRLRADAPIHIHIAEQLREVTECEAYYGQRPVAWLMDQVALDQHWCLVHATHLSQQELTDLAASDAVAGICVTTEANLGDGVFPSQAFLALGGAMAIGSDSHISVNVAEEIRWLEYNQRLQTNQRAVLAQESNQSVAEMLYTHTAEKGAQCTSQPVGLVAPGRRADLVTFDENHPSLFHKEARYLLDSAVFSAPSLPISNVMVAGQWQIIDGQHRDQTAIVARYRQTLARLLKS